MTPGPFEQAGREMIAAIAAGLGEIADDIMEDSLAECPIDTGTLKRSARRQEPEVVGGNVSVEMGYGYGFEINPKTRRPAAEYAVPVHERIEVHHEPPTKAKFLEDPLLLHAGAIERMLGEKIQATLRLLAFSSSG